MINNYHKDKTPGKGKEGENCNVTACQAPESAFYFNTAMNAWYCHSCAYEINRFAKMDGQDLFPKFEEHRDAEEAAFNKRHNDE